VHSPQQQIGESLGLGGEAWPNWSRSERRRGRAPCGGQLEEVGGRLLVVGVGGHGGGHAVEAGTHGRRAEARAREEERFKIELESGNSGRV
jgi:hypothetical protein